MNTPPDLLAPPRPASPRPSSNFSIHDHTMKPPPRYKTVALPPPPPHPTSCQPSSSSTSAAAHLLIVVFCVVVATIVAPLPLTIRHVSSATVFLQTVAPSPPPPHPASRQPSLSSAFDAAHLLIVVFCNCRQHRCSPSTTDRPPCLFSRHCPPPHPPSSATSFYRRP